MSYALQYPSGLGLSFHCDSRGTSLVSCLRKIASDIMPDVRHQVSKQAPTPQPQQQSKQQTPQPGVTPNPPNQVQQSGGTPIDRNNRSAKPYGFFDSLGSIWNFLVSRLRLWWYKNNIKSGNLTKDQWNTIHADAKELSTNRFAHSVGSFIDPNKYDTGYFEGLPQFMRGVQRAHEFNNGVYNSDDKQLTQDRNDVRHMYNYGNRYGFLDEEFNKKYKDGINFVTNPHLSNTAIRVGGAFKSLFSGSGDR